jgi:hypothetical protein
MIRRQPCDSSCPQNYVLECVPQVPFQPGMTTGTTIGRKKAVARERVSEEGKGTCESSPHGASHGWEPSSLRPAPGLLAHKYPQHRVQTPPPSSGGLCLTSSPGRVIPGWDVTNASSRARFRLSNGSGWTADAPGCTGLSASITFGLGCPHPPTPSLIIQRPAPWPGGRSSMAWMAILSSPPPWCSRRVRICPPHGGVFPVPLDLDRWP